MLYLYISKSFPTDLQVFLLLMLWFLWQLFNAWSNSSLSYGIQEIKHRSLSDGQFFLSLLLLVLQIKYFSFSCFGFLILDVSSTSLQESIRHFSLSLLSSVPSINSFKYSSFRSLVSRFSWSSSFSTLDPAFIGLLLLILLFWSCSFSFKIISSCILHYQSFIFAFSNIFLRNSWSY